MFLFVTSIVELIPGFQGSIILREPLEPLMIQVLSKLSFMLTWILINLLS